MREEGSSGGGTSPLVVALVAVLSALIGAGASLGVAYFTFASKDQELKVHLVEIAIGILRADPKEDVGPARGWALDVIEKNSGTPFSTKDRVALLGKPLPYGGDLRSALRNMIGPEGFITTTTTKAGIDAGNALAGELRSLGITIVGQQALEPSQISESKVSCYDSVTCEYANALVPLLRSRGYTLGKADKLSWAEDNSVEGATALYNANVIRIVLLDPKPGQPVSSP
jgi:hypothetical protein